MCIIRKSQTKRHTSLALSWQGRCSAYVKHTHTNTHTNSQNKNLPVCLELRAQRAISLILSKTKKKHAYLLTFLDLFRFTVSCANLFAVCAFIGLCDCEKNTVKATIPQNKNENKTISLRINSNRQSFHRVNSSNMLSKNNR